MNENPNEKLEVTPEDAEAVKPEEEKAAPAEEAKPEEVKSPEEEDIEKVDEMEKEVLYELQTYREVDNEANNEAVNAAEEKLKKIFDDLRKWLEENTNPEAVRERLQKAADDVNRVVQDTKQRVIEVSNSEQFKKTMEAGRDFIVGTGSLIADGVKYGADQLMKNPTINKAVTTVDEKLDVLRENKALQDGVDRMEEAVDKLNAAIFTGLKKFFEKPDRPESASKAEEPKAEELPKIPDSEPEEKEN